MTCEQYIEVVEAGAANTNDRLDDHHQMARQGHALDIAIALAPYHHEPIRVPEACCDEMVMAEHSLPQAIIHRGSLILLDDPHYGFRYIDSRVVLNLDDPESSSPGEWAKGAGKPELAEIAGPMAGA